MRLAGHEVVILADAGAVGGGNPGQIRPVRHWGDSRATFVPRGLRAQLHDLDLLYLHEGWTLSNLAAARACRAEGLPYVVMPHGVYEPGITSTLKPPLGPRTRAERWVLERAEEVAAVHAAYAGAGAELIQTCTFGALRARLSRHLLVLRRSRHLLLQNRNWHEDTVACYEQDRCDSCSTARQIGVAEQNRGERDPPP